MTLAAADLFGSGDGGAGLGQCAAGNAVFYGDFYHLIRVPGVSGSVVDRGYRDAAGYKIACLGKHGSGQSIRYSRIIQIQAFINCRRATEQLQGVSPELCEESLLGGAIVDNPVRHRNSGGYYRGLVPSSDDLSPDTVIRWEDNRRIVAGIKTVHSQFIPGQHHIGLPGGYTDAVNRGSGFDCRQWCQHW